MSAGPEVRRWILLAAVASFVAGFGVGLVVPAAAHAMAPDDAADPDAVYVRELGARYGLDGEQMRLVRMVLEERDREHRRAVMGDLKRLPVTLRNAVDAANRRAEERIKEVLTEAQRERFLRDSEPAIDAVRPGPDGSASAEDR